MQCLRKHQIFAHYLKHSRFVSTCSNSSRKINTVQLRKTPLPLATELLADLHGTHCWQEWNRKAYSTSAEEDLLDLNLFEKVCEETLESLTDYFEELIESDPNLKNADVSYSSGVLTVAFGPLYGTYVINKQTPNRQIWLSSPTSGPKRYDFIVDGKFWVYKHTGETLHKLLQQEIPTIVKNKADFATCTYSRF